ncbi:uncharacterized protein B0H64DRAFT_444249 [Chaetomium fimeti]|uniref:Uncharacterized protein n=1 Tax=Chaetomium fimeti TaxID=1854472 RepID=A0AAE0LPP6_9PEZI|nr:hypothetical protein B0H64DRAFT_444249 [Chaetomium fimeti]
MLTHILLLAATSLAAVARGAVLPGTTTDGPAPVLHAIPDDVASFNETQGISARAVDPAVRFTEYEGRACGGWEAPYMAPDGGCYLLPTGDGFKIREIANTCRVFIYASQSCDGAEFQAYHGNCYDVHAFYSIKAFCG